LLLLVVSLKISVKFNSKIQQKKTIFASFLLSVFRDFVHQTEPIKPNQVPCIKFDDCGICLGDNSSCTDCAGVVNGDAALDACGVCNGDGSSCASQPVDTTIASSSSSSLAIASALFGAALVVLIN
jgi:hypothetical protein